MIGYWTAWFALAAATSPSSSRLGHSLSPDEETNKDDNDNDSNSYSRNTRLNVCRSNETHVVWHDGSGETCLWQSLQDAQKDSYDYLQSNIMNFDLPFAETIGFHKNNDDNKSNNTEPDGLADGLIRPAIDLALRAKLDFAYTDRLPRGLWQEYVLNYANLNEARSSVRRLLRERLVEPLFLKDNSNENRSIAETVFILNTHMWRMLSHNSTSSIVFVSGQTPAIFDPMSVLAFGYASCTGLAILFVEALRTAGVPARVAGTAAWNRDRSKGNHNWVEVWTGTKDCDPHGCDCENDDDDNNNNNKLMCQQCGWAFLEPSPAQTLVDTVDRNPCERWFCHPDRLANGTQVYAARLDQTAASARFPLAWEWGCHDVPAVDRTAYYQRVCSGCGKGGDDRDGSSAGNSEIV